MAIDINGFQFLLLAYREGLKFKDVLTLGRLNINFYPRSLPFPQFHSLEPNGYAEPLFKWFGARTVDSLDASPYEGATVIHDLNQPVPRKLWNTYDLVYDGGTLEHVFHFPQAIVNAMNMVRVGGHLILHTPANNTMGHGFYQFSPELFHRLFTYYRGFRLKHLIIHRAGPGAKWYEVADPMAVHSRVELINFVPTQMLVLAQRISENTTLARPQQADFAPQWNGSPNQGGAATSLAARARKHVDALARYVPRLARLINVALIAIAFYRTFSLSNRQFYKPIQKPL